MDVSRHMSRTPSPTPKPRTPLAPAAALLALVAGAAACVQPVAETADSSGATVARVRRLTRAEYDATASAVLGVPVDAAASWAAEDPLLGYTAHDRLQVTALLADQLDASAGQLAKLGVSRLAQLAPCPAGSSGAACARAFVEARGPLAWRRPLTPEEVDGLLLLYATGATHAEGMEQLLHGLFAAPSFVYRTELGPRGAVPGSVVELTPHEVASAISYALTGGPPDAPLREAAQAGALATPEQREAHARRLLTQTPAGRAQLRRFVDEWFGLTAIRALNKNNQVYPNFHPDLLVSMEAEKDALVEHVLANENGSLRALLAADYSFVDDAVAQLYGLPDRPGATPARVQLPPERAGLLTTPALLSVYAHFDGSSPVRRGKFVHTRLLCRTISPPPPSLNTTPPPPADNLTTRERFAQHAADATCYSCHKFIDPLGFGMEDFDGLGQHRTTEVGKPIDASGSVPDADGNPGQPYVGGAALARMLADDPAVSDCVANQAFRFAMGRVERDPDAPTLRAMREDLRAADGSILAPFVSLVRQPSFTRRLVQAP